MAQVERAAAAPPADIAGEGLFIRKSSGLVREMGKRDTFAVNAGVMTMIGGVSALAIFQVAFPNADYYIPILVGAAISLVLCLSYTQLVSSFPRAGGEYVYASRIFGPVTGAMAGGALLIAICLNCANTVIALGQIVVPLFFTTIGEALHIHSLVTFGSSTLIAKTPYLIVGLIAIGVFVLIGLRPLGSVARWVFWSFLLGAIGFFVVIGLLFFESHAGFVHAFNAASGGKDAYAQVIAQATKGGFLPGATVGAAIAAIPIGFLWFSGFTFANYAGGEIKRPTTTYKFSVLAALALGLAGALLLWAALRHTVGLHFLQSSAALQSINPAAYAKLTSLQQNQGGLAYAVLVSGDPVTKILIAFGALGGFLANGLVYFVLASRVVFALSFDRLLPTKMADVREKTHSPVYAVALIAMIVLAFTILGDETSLLTIFRNLLLIAVAILVVGSAAVTILPFRRKDLYDGSPKAFRGSVLGVPMISVLGALSTIGCLFMDVELATHTAYSGGYSAGSIITLVIVATLGLAMYSISRLYMQQRGVDLRMAMRELPPE